MVTATLLVGMLAASAVPAAELHLARNGLAARINPDFGGRITAFYKHGSPSLLAYRADAAIPPTEVGPDTPDQPMLGHSLWIAPQSAWWNHQDLLPDRRGALWPPDPYLTIATTEVMERGPDRLRLRGPESPVSGLQLEQRFKIGDDLAIEALATNIRDEPVAWGLWFNTRIVPTACLYVPVDTADDVDVEATGEPRLAAPAPRLIDGLLELCRQPTPTGYQGRQGKLRIRPSQGWMAAVLNGQALVIRFERVTDLAIHPEHGQVELYLRHLDDDAELQILEMELHAPYRELEPGESMTAAEHWQIHDTAGDSDLESRRAFFSSLGLFDGGPGAPP